MATTARGQNVSLNILEQTDFKTVAAGNAVRVSGLISADIGGEQSFTDAQDLRSSREPSEQFDDGRTGGGSFAFHPDARSVGWILKHLYGAPVTSGVGPYTHVFKVGDPPVNGLTIERWHTDLTRSIRLIGAILGGLSFSVSPRGLLQWTVNNIIAHDFADAGALIDAAPLIYAKDVFRLPAVTLAEGGTALAIGTSLNINIDEQLDPYEVIGSELIEEIGNGILSCTGSLETLWRDMTLYNKAVNRTESSLKLTMVSAKTPAHSLELFLPEIKYRLQRINVGGPGGIRAGLEFFAHYDNAAEATSQQWTLINDIASYATIPVS